MSIERGQQDVEPHGIVVVQQKPYVHPTIRRGAYSSKQQRTGNIAAPDVVADIKRALGALCQKVARGKGIARIEQWVDAGKAGMRGSYRGDRSSELGIACVERRRRRSATIERWQG